jgi:hypothetical protein
MYFYVIAALVFGIVASVIAYGKGRNSLGWFLAGCAIGPFALIVALLPAVPADGRYVRCLACAEVIQADATVCRHCGTVVTEGVPESS